MKIHRGSAMYGGAQLGQSTIRHDAVAMALHWSTVLLVIAQFFLSLTWAKFSHPVHHLMVVAHMSFGMLLTAIVAFRIAWRIYRNHRGPSSKTGQSDAIATAVHGLLYVLLVVEALLGFGFRWAGNQAMSFFGYLIASPFSPLSRPTRQLIGEAHQWVGWSIVILGLGHAGIALYHQFVLKDGALERMLPSRVSVGR